MAAAEILVPGVAPAGATSEKRCLESNRHGKTRTASKAAKASKSKPRMASGTDANARKVVTAGVDDATRKLVYKERRSGVGLLPNERAELNHHWAGAEAAVGFRSLHGAIEDKLLRAPPNEGIGARLIDHLEMRGGHYEHEELVAEVVMEHGATAHEARRSIQRLALFGHLRLTVDDVHRKQDRPVGMGGIGENNVGAEAAHRVREFDEPAVIVHLLSMLDKTPPKRLTREERWARLDQEARDITRWWMPSCHESPQMPAREYDGGDDELDREIEECREAFESRAKDERMSAAVDGRPVRARRCTLVHTAPDPAAERLRSVAVAARVMIERIYGYSSTPAYVNEYQGVVDVARAVEFTPTVERRRRRAVEAMVEARLGDLEAERVRQEAAVCSAVLRLAELRKVRADRPKPDWASMTKQEHIAYMRAGMEEANELRSLEGVVRAGVTITEAAEHLRETLDGTISPQHVIDQILFQQPTEKAARAKWLQERRAFVQVTTDEATWVLEWLSETYRGETNLSLSVWLEERRK